MIAKLCVAGALAGALVGGLVIGTGVAGAATAKRGSSLTVGSSLTAGSGLRSPDGHYSATVRPDGRLIVRHGTKWVWSSAAKAAHPRLKIRPSGNLVITSGAHLVWSSGTAGSRATKLTLGNNGMLALHSAAGTVWTSSAGNACRRSAPSGKSVTVDLSRQSALLCNGPQQVLTTRITSGASAYGNGTPTGTWRLQAKQRDTYLYPAAGGAYFVHYWMPYDGAYGMHDSSWQKFPYGSSKYRTEGSHGCVHFPRAAIAFMFRWAPVGTTVAIHA